MKLLRHRLSLSGLALLAAVALVAGCSSSSDSSTNSSSGTSAVTSATSAATSAEVYQGVLGTPPTTTVALKSTGLVWVVSCGQSVPTCASPAESAVEAAEAAGWTAKLCDGQLNPQGWSACIRQGISAKAAGIIVIGQDCDSFQAALKEAKTAGIPTVAAGGNDCDVRGGEKLFSAVVQNMPDLTAEQWWKKMGALQADWIIEKTDAKAQVLSLKFTDSIWGGWIQDGFTTELATCSGCKVLDTLTIGNADVAGGQLTQKFATALLKQPKANAVNVPLDGWFFAGLSQAVQSSGRADSLAVIGNFGETGNLDLIRKGTGEDATVGFSAPWVGWAGVDALARTLAGQPTQPAGIGLQVIDSDHNLPESGTSFAYSPAVDFRAAYTKDWSRG
ncbi:substrate-binding domain-containing protein [Parafrankia sp. EUN1f]|uniref:sugar ABC transporter substrate-binding protein n=1 Tax=Parafrankia sp. EUN1f TaxID=102897 RepID=UPI0001C445F0|nr:substrate-binding domain-containing protein [Parafrankia sp. EUN1f]EFC86748.1 ABC-type sugar transport system periplasmic component-like protein [Parafrankia sp. EUN1f]